MTIWKVEKIDFFRGWVVMKSYGDRDQYWTFPETDYGVLDSETVTAHPTQEAAEMAMAALQSETHEPA